MADVDRSRLLSEKLRLLLDVVSVGRRAWYQCGHACGGARDAPVSSIQINMRSRNLQVQPVMPRTIYHRFQGEPRAPTLKAESRGPSARARSGPEDAGAAADMK